MEDKSVILSVLLMSLVIAQIQVEAKSCCPNTTARNLYNSCRFAGGSRPVCAGLSGCKIISGNKCPPGYPNLTFETHGDAVNEYCKLGCVSSVCGAVATLQDADQSEVVNGLVEQCTNTCAAICLKGSATTNALEV